MLPARTAWELSQEAYARRECRRVEAQLAKIERLVMSAVQTGAFHVDVEVSSIECKLAELESALKTLGYRYGMMKRGRVFSVSWGGTQGGSDD